MRVIVVAAVAAAAFAFAGAARAGDLQFNDDYPFGDSPPVTFTANQVVNASGVIEYIGGGNGSCSDPEGKSDFVYPAADVYVIPAGGPLADGAALHDVSGPLAHTVIQYFSVGFELQSIGVTAPTGRIGAGVYDVVFDECQDGKFTAGEDEQFAGAFTVDMPADVPPIDPAIHDLKISAAKEAAPWLAAEATLLAIDAYQKVQEVLECIEAGPVGCAVSYVTDQLKEWMTEKIMSALGLEDPKEGMRRLIRSELQHWAAIAADPPDSNYATPVSLPPIESLTAPRSDAITQAQFAVANDSAVQSSLTEAILHAMERYQGADAASNGDAALLHARELERYSTLLAQQIEKSNADLDAYAAAVAADPRDFDKYASRLAALRADIVAHGFTDEEKTLLRNAGLSNADVASLADQIAASDPAAGGESEVAARVAALKSANSETLASLQQTAASMNAIETQLVADPNTFGLDPVADAGGPYTTTEGGTVTLNGTVTHTNAGRTITSYAWDTDGDGQFDDATTATPIVSFPVARSGLVGFRVTDDAGSTGTAYAQITVTDANHAPSIGAVTPDSSQVSLQTGASQTFTVTASDPDGDPVAIQWLVDGHAVASGTAFAYSPSTADAGTHVIEAVASDGRADGGSDVHDWAVRALPPDADGDGYVAAAFSDCDDGDPAIHPGAVEVVGNVKDDDCDPTTLDTGSPPHAAFATTPAAAGSPFGFADTSTDPNDDVIGWTWSFGDGGTSSEQAPSHVYAASGTYTVSLTVTDATGNTNATSRDVVVSDAPVADFTFQPASPAAGGAVQFTDASHETNGTITAWHWEFGDGDTSSEQSPEHTFTGVGDHDVVLTVTDANGLTGTVTKTVTTIAGDPSSAPHAGFAPQGGRNLADGAGAGPATVVSFSGSCQCGDHTPHNMLDAVITSLPWAAPAGPNQFAVIKLKGDGTSPIDRIGVQPRADGCCPAQGVREFAVDVSQDGTAWTQVLSATTANAQTLQMFDVPVPAAGAFIRYRPLSNWGDCCWFSTSRFMAVTNHAGPATVSFVNSSTNAVSYKWTFGDGTTSTAAAPTHTYAGPGTYTVTLTARSADGRSSTKTDTYSVTGVVPGFTHTPAAPAPGAPVAFDDASSLVGGASEASVSWEFGDGATLTGAHAAHAYASAGTYVVRMTVVDDAGAAWSTTQAIVVGGANATLTARFQPRLAAGPTDVARDFRGTTVTATRDCCHSAPATLIDGDPSDLWWASDKSPGQSVLLTLAGTRIVDGVSLALRANWWEMFKDFQVSVSTTSTDDAAFTTVFQGTTDWSTGNWQQFSFAPTKARYVKVTELTIWNPATCCAGLGGIRVLSGSDGGQTVTFHNLSSGADSYAWDFGDGTTSTDAEPTHTYTAPGTYTVTLTASKGGASETYSAEQVVSAATFAFAPSAPVDGDRVQFTDGTNASFGAKSWVWAFGDGASSTFQSPMHIYASPGTYQVTETVTSLDGGTSTATRTVTVGAAGVSAGFAAQVRFDAAASISGASITAASGQYDGCWIPANILHRLPGNCGTTGWASGNGVGGRPAWARVALAPAPGGGSWTIDSFSVTPRTDNQSQRPLQVELAVSETGADGSFSVVYEGDLADNGSPQTFTLARPVTARYVEYRTFGNRGDSCCTSTTRLTVNGVNSSDGLTVAFANASRHATTYSWNFGDGSSSTGAAPTHSYAAAGTYAVALTACDGASCDTTTQQLRVLAPISASFAFTNLPATEGQVVTIQDTAPAPAQGTVAYEDWTFGDGQSASVVGSLGHYWGDNGTYTVTESVTTTLQQTASATRQIQIANADPTVELGADRQIYERNWLDYSYAYGDPGSSEGLVCTADYGDGSAPETGGCGRAYHRYPAGPRAYTLTVTIRDKDGGSAVDTTRVTTLRRAQSGYASVDFAEPFPGSVAPAPFNCCGPIGLAFDSANQLYVSDYPTGYLYRFGPGGGVPDDAKKLPGNVGCHIAGLAFSKTGRLYGARQSCSDVVEIDPATGNVLRVVTSGIPCATGLATDPVSGDLFVTSVGCDGYLYRVHPGEDGSPVSRTTYTPWIGGVDGITIGPDGTMWLELDGWLAKVAGTDQPNAGQTTRIVQVPYFDGVALSASSDPSQPSYLYANRNDGIITKIDLSTPTPTLTDIYKGGTRGDFVGVGPDGCLYATQSDAVIKLTFADGTCGLASTSVVPQLSLTPQSAAAFTGAQHTVTATLANVLAPAGTLVTFTVTGANTATGTALADGTGAATFSYVGTHEGTDTVTATSAVGTTNLTSNPATVVWARPPNSAPVAATHAYSTHAGVPLVVAAPGVLAGATDADGDALTVDSSTPPAHGTVTIAADGRLTYTPAAGFVGDDTFDYRLSDGKVLSAPATITIHVTNAPPAGSADSYTTHMGQTLVVPAPGVLANDVDADGDSLTASSEPQHPQHGIALLANTGALEYRPDPGFAGTDTFTYTPNDGFADGAPVTVTITVANAAPVAADDLYTTLEGQTLTVPNPGVLTNDSDPDGDPLTRALLVTQAAHGQVALAFAGGLVYVPEPGFHGVDSFTYTVGDGASESQPGTVRIMVDGAPTAVGDDLSTHSGVTLAISYGDLTANDSDPEGEPLFVDAGSLGTPQHGTLTVGAAGVTYVPARGFAGDDTFTYRASDGRALSAPATVTIHVTDAAPVAADDAYSVHAGSVLHVAAPGPLSNDGDPDGDPVEVATATQPQHGTFLLSAAGELTYTPAPGYAGPDSFTYRVTDGARVSEPATIALDVTDTAPVAAADEYAVHFGRTLHVDAPGVLANDVDADGDPLTASAVVDHPQHGQIALAFTGALEYVPAAGYVGDDSFTYTPSDGFRAGAPVQVTVHMTDSAPVAGPDTATVLQGDTVTGNVLSNDSDPDGDALSVALAAAPRHGIATIGPDGAFTYVPDASYSGPDGFTYLLSDGGLSVAGRVEVTVVARNHAPTVSLAPAEPVDEGAAPITLAATGSDPDAGQTLSYAWSVTSNAQLVPSGSTAAFSSDDGPATATVTVRACDDGSPAACAEASQPIEVRNVAPAVTAAANPSPVPWGLPVHFAGAASDPSRADTAYGFVYRWSFGDSVLSPDDDVVHPYAVPGLYTASFTAVDKDAGLGSRSVDVAVTKRATAVAFVAPTTQPFGPVQLSARLSDLADAATAQVGGRTLTFTAGGRTFTATTNAAGVATVFPAPFLLSGPVTVSFGGNALYLPSSTGVQLTITNAFGNGPGFFTLGDRTPTTGTVNWWGSQWEKTNVLSGGSAPAAFKGYVDAPAVQGCGGSWTTDPGNSSGPPASVGPYVAVVVASRIAKSGSTISGTVVHILAVKTAAGYGPAPGHGGSGQVVGAVC